MGWLKEILLPLAAVLVVPAARLGARGAIALVKMSPWKEDDEFLRELAKNILKEDSGL